MEQIGISIIIPVYNVEKYIESCISSVLRQDYKGHIECIIIDDCGQDNSIQIAQNITSHAPSNIDIKYIFHKKIQVYLLLGIQELKRQLVIIYSF